MRMTVRVFCSLIMWAFLMVVTLPDYSYASSVFTGDQPTSMVVLVSLEDDVAMVITDTKSALLLVTLNESVLYSRDSLRYVTAPVSNYTPRLNYDANLSDCQGSFTLTDGWVGQNCQYIKTIEYTMMI